MTGIVVGVCIALTCILICVLILICRSKASTQYKAIIPGWIGVIRYPYCDSSPVNEFQIRQGCSNLIINGYGQIVKQSTKNKCLFFKGNTKDNAGQYKRKTKISVYCPGTTVLMGEDGSPTSPGHPGTFQMRHSIAADTEHSGNSEESHETSDSGRYSHESTDEIHLCSVISTSPPTPDSFSVEECGKDPSLSKHGKSPSVNS